MLHFRLHFLPDMPKRELLIFYKVVQLRIDKVITMSLVCYFYFLGHSVVWLMLHRKVRVLCPSSHYLFLSFTKIYSTFVMSVKFSWNIAAIVECIVLFLFPTLF